MIGWWAVLAVLSLSIVSDCLWPHGGRLPGSSVHGDSLGKNTGVGCPPGHLPNPGIKPRSPALQVDFLLSEPQGKPDWLMGYMIITRSRLLLSYYSVFFQIFWTALSTLSGCIREEKKTVIIEKVQAWK